VIETLLNRKSMHAYEDREIEPDVKAAILQTTLRAPTAGNMMLYSIIDVTDQRVKDKLAVTCDNQPFIARAPMVWIFLADYQRWNDYFIVSDVALVCQQNKQPVRTPEEGDLFLACCDALIAAQNAVSAAESFGLGSCYIGDVIEQYEAHKELLNLPQFVFPICMLVFGYPTQQQKDRGQTSRFDEKFIAFENGYRQLESAEFDEMFVERESQMPKGKAMEGIANFGQATYLRKFGSDFAIEMNRSARAWLKGMGRRMKITYLANYPEHVSTIAKWVMDQWGHESPGSMLEPLEKKFRGNMNRNTVSLTLLAIDEDRPLGTASLMVHDMKDHRELSPWLAAVYVLPDQRRKGIGSKLVKSIELLATNLQVEKLYLFTPDRESFYARMGWTVFERTSYHEKDVVIKVKEL